MTKLAAATQDKRDAADAAFVVPLRTALTGLRDYLQAGPVTQQNLPNRLKDQWIAARRPHAGPGLAEGRSQRQ